MHKANYSINGKVNYLSLVVSLSTVHFSGNGKVATKLICYTRSTPSIHQLPAMYPKAALPSAEQPSNDLVEDLICDKVYNCNCNLSHRGNVLYIFCRLTISSFVNCLVFPLRQPSNYSYKHLRLPNSKLCLFW